MREQTSEETDRPWRKNVMSNSAYSASRLTFEGTRASGKERNQIAKRFGGAESGEEARIKWACPDLCKFFISASPERSEILLVEKR